MKVPEFLTEAVQPNKSESVRWAELTFIQSTNAECMPRSDTASHQDTQNMWIVNIKLHDVSLLMLFPDIE